MKIDIMVLTIVCFCGTITADELRGYRKMSNAEFQKNHVLPTVRIHKIVLNNFKSVQHGEIVFACAKKFVPQDTCSDILGIYGQNGSGKTAVIEALGILKRALCGISVPPTYAECVPVGMETSQLEFTFDLQYPEPAGYRRTVVYSFDLKRVPAREKSEDAVAEGAFVQYPYDAVICNETVSASGWFDGEETNKHTIINSVGGKLYPIGPVSNLEPLVGNNKDGLIIDFQVYKRLAYEKSQSFIFNKDTLDLLHENSNYSEVFQVLLELSLYGRDYLYIVDTRAAGGRFKTTFPLNTRFGRYELTIFGSNHMPKDYKGHIEAVLKNINTVLGQIIPDLQVVPKIVGTEKKEDGEEWFVMQLMAHRGDIEMPLRDESEGIIKLVSILALLAAAFNDRSCTVAIDELDSGIYEYLLGEILIAIEEYGKGQLIFTSHNLRPLEVLKKEEIVFTTTTPENRYIRLKGVGRTNNLRDLYLREVVEEGQEEPLYNASKRFKMIAAFKKAGRGYGEEDKTEG